MEIKKFATEHFFAKYEFTTPHQLCNSDCETVTIQELLEMRGTSFEEFGALALGYTESLGHPDLREKIAETYNNITPGDVVVLGSPVEGIYLVARAVLNRGDEAIVLTPAYDALINLFEHIVGPANVKKWSFIPAESRWELDFDHLRNLITSKTKLLVVNFPHNPTGYLPSQDHLEELVTLVEDNHLTLFCDEMYFGLVHSGTPEVLSAVDLTSRAVVLAGLSKSYGLPGLRSGWLVIQDKELRSNIANWKFYTSICPPAPTEYLAMAALDVREKLLERSVAQIENNLRTAEDFFQNWPDLFTWRRPMAGSVALVGMNVPSVEAFADKLAQEAGVLILPATTLGSDDHHLRMGFGRRAFGNALGVFETYLNKDK